MEERTTSVDRRRSKPLPSAVRILHSFAPERLTTDQETDHVTDQVKRLLSAMGSRLQTARQLMETLHLSHRPTFRNNYLRPALDAGWIAMTHPDTPRSRNQAYSLTDKGRRVRDHE